MNLFYLVPYFLLVYADKLDFDLVTDYSVNDCLRVNNTQKLNYFALDEDGFPYCGTYTDAAACNPDIANSCEPGLKCGTNKTCEVDITSCFKYYANVTGNSKMQKLLWTPDCQEDGSWASKQCKGGAAGRCFCYDSKGERIFGNAFADNSANMTCACSKRKSELLDPTNLHNRTYVSFHCDEQGNYEELQCDTDHCWCVDTQTGELTSKIVPENSMTYLKCSGKLQGSQYLRKCESVAFAQTKITEIMKTHGVISPNIQRISCESDGSYGPYTITNSQVTCVTRTNSVLQYQASIKDITSMDCNCAYDQDLYNRIGKSFTLECQNNGNYKPFQSAYKDETVKSFCVDKDGNKKIDNVNVNETDSYCEQFYD
ncbi:hypothetical protein HHI36_002512 [Cryptolaemus montrouzieri]|uniref:Thyroglobulin type-1 domain-containing protein n=1 Tax=Cryptolaemus montrouzieri TaxID=559131 RepID=A0ABD2PAR7_9CUCU